MNHSCTRGENSVSVFLEKVFEIEQEIQGEMEKPATMIISPEEEEEFKNAIHCHICNAPFNDKVKMKSRVRDHCHITGKYRGAAHNDCNLHYKVSKKIPVIFHNLKGYDGHLIMQEIGKFNCEVQVIAQSMEKYVTFRTGNLVFIDSFQFLNTSLDNLVKNLAKEGDAKFRNMKQQYEGEKLQLLLRKGVYPYEYFDSPEKFEEQHLPPPESFFSSLNDTGISKADYEHAQKVWKAFGMHTLGDYHDLYVLTDVLLLSDVFENFRDFSLNVYELDPAHSFTLPGFSWQAMLKMTGVRLELLTDPDMHLFIENGIRGGISVISKRYAKANNDLVSNYDETKPKTWIMYLDANNLYGKAMSEALPTHGFRWLNEEERMQLLASNFNLDNGKGYIVECDLEIPDFDDNGSLHDWFADYPLAPEKLKISTEMISKFSSELLADLNMKHLQSEKLVGTLLTKSGYILDVRVLKLYLELGAKLKVLKRILTFKQSPWMKPYIMFNTEMRAHAKNAFEKDLFKLFNNAAFGKTMENKRKRRDIKLITSEKRMKKEIKKTYVCVFQEIR